MSVGRDRTANSQTRAPQLAGDREARELLLTGRVQGVGFRPFVYRLASRLQLAGFVRNLSGQVLVHVEGPRSALDEFESALLCEAPALARPLIERTGSVAPAGWSRFTIEPSAAHRNAEIHLPPDQSICPECLAELGDPRDRRYRYPFINCTQCGPRYTLITELPYDRASTTMAHFPLCPECRSEYESPADRRFHAEPLACPACGPTLSFTRTGRGHPAIVGNEAALAAAVSLLRSGGIVATRGIGGYHLMCDAASDTAIAALRARKRRPEKPLAVLFPMRGCDGLDVVRAAVALDGRSAAALVDPARPIVLARRLPDGALSRGLAPDLGDLGVFLPYSPLHHLLSSDFGAPLVATSGNISGEPVITDRPEAEQRLGAIADAFLHHDREIVRPADDPVVAVIDGEIRAVRLGRGTAPLEVALPVALAEPVLAVGGQGKVTLAIGWENRAIVSPHIGDLDTVRGFDQMVRVAADLARLYRVRPARIACDAHSGYSSTRWARRQGLPVLHVQHHAAHASALAVEHPDVQRWLVFAWDGVGSGDDGTLWGGEALLGQPGSWRRVASFRHLRPPGGDLAAHAPWRSAAALCWETELDYTPTNLSITELVRQAWGKGINAPPTSAVGRLFDAAAALVAGVETTSFEGQAAIRLQHLASKCPDADAIASPPTLPLYSDDAGVLRCDWRPLVPMLADMTNEPALRARRFHAALAAALAAHVDALLPSVRFDAIGLTGGVFQNRLLAEDVLARLAARSIRAYMPALAPANDGGLALGQLAEASARLAQERT